MTEFEKLDTDQNGSLRRMAWAALGMMIVTTIATLIDPARMASAESVLMTQYIALSGLVGAYFALSGKTGSKSE